MKRHLIAAISLSLSLGLCGMHSAALAQETKEDLTATNGDAAALGNRERLLGAGDGDAERRLRARRSSVPTAPTASPRTRHRS